MKLLAETLVELAKERAAQEKNRTAGPEAPQPDDPKQVKSLRAGRTDDLEAPVGNRNRNQKTPGQKTRGSLELRQKRQRPQPMRRRTYR